MSTSSIQFYRIRYILAKLVQFIDEQAYSTSIDLDDLITSQIHIEHILPQTPLPEVIQAFDDPEKIRLYIQQLGNLTLLERSINSSLSNGFYEHKRDIYKQSKYLLAKSIPEKIVIGQDTAIDRAVRDLPAFNAWTSHSIQTRQDMLTELSYRVWDMPKPVG